MPKGFLFGTKGKTKKLSKLDAGQQQLLDLINEGLTTGEGPLKDIFGEFDQGAFEKGVSEPALKQFKEQILPGIQEKFIAGNQSRGSAILRANAQAAGGLQAKLAELMYNAQNQQKQNRMQGVNTALGTNAVENIYKPGTEGLVQGAVKGLAQGAGNATGAAIAG